jgi:hypothetical protein
VPSNSGEIIDDRSSRYFTFTALNQNMCTAMAPCSHLQHLGWFLGVLLTMQAVLGTCPLVNASADIPGASAYIAAAGFPTSAFPYEPMFDLETITD